MTARRKVRPVRRNGRPPRKPHNSWNEMLRRHCTECGCRGLDWMSVREAAHELGSAELARLVELMRESGIDVDDEYAEVWLCLYCRNFGAMSGWTGM